MELPVWSSGMIKAAQRMPCCVEPCELSREGSTVADSWAMSMFSLSILSSWTGQEEQEYSEKSGQFVSLIFFSQVGWVYSNWNQGTPSTVTVDPLKEGGMECSPGLHCVKELPFIVTVPEVVYSRGGSGLLWLMVLEASVHGHLTLLLPQ